MFLYRIFKLHFWHTVLFLVILNMLVIFRCGFETYVYNLMAISFSVTFAGIFISHVMPFVKMYTDDREMFGLLFIIAIIIFYVVVGIISKHEHGASITLAFSSFFLGWLSVIKVLDLEYEK